MILASTAIDASDSDDPWLAPDKLQHVLFCFSLACAGFALAAKSASSTPAQRLLAGALLASLGGVLKELGDFLGWWPGRASPRDAAADAVGAALGLAACVLFVSLDCGERMVREWKRRLEGGGDGYVDRGTARSRGEYRGLELFSPSSSSSAAAEGKV